MHVDLEFLELGHSSRVQMEKNCNLCQRTRFIFDNFLGIMWCVDFVILPKLGIILYLSELRKLRKKGKNTLQFKHYCKKEIVFDEKKIRPEQQFMGNQKKRLQHANEKWLFCFVFVFN